MRLRLEALQGNTYEFLKLESGNATSEVPPALNFQ